MWFRSLFDALLARSSRTLILQRQRASKVRRCFRPLLEILEDRTLLSTYTVNSLTDTGAGSDLTGDLRYCVTNATSGNDTITFAPGLAGTIQLQSNLPTLNASVDIQGPGAPLITVDGDEAHFYDVTVDSAADVQIAGLTMAHLVFDNKVGSASVSNCTFDSSAIDIEVGSATFSNCTFHGFPITTDTKTINTGTTLTLNNCTLDTGAYIVNSEKGAALTVSNCTVSNGSIGNDAAGGSATISYTTLSGSYIENDPLASETISYSTISGYTGNGSGGAPPDAAGAIVNSGNLTIDNSTISGNKAVGGPAYWVATYSGAFTFNGGNGMGGGIYMGGGTLSVDSSTIADNEAIGGSTGSTSFAGNGLGGGLYIAGGTVSINNSTFADNQTIGGAGPIYGPGQGYGGGIYNAAGASALQMHDTIVANNTAVTAPDLYGGVSSLGYNMIGNSSGGSGYAASDLLNVNPQLGPLQNNGGPTQTMALLAGSPAINTGDNTNAPAYDQRGPGFARIVNGTIDIGAFEVQNGNSNQASSLTVAGFPSVITAGNSGSFTVTAKKADGNIDTSYTGAVQFTSSDGQAVLPANYTFTAADAGVHVFSATLKTTGIQSLTATDNFGLSGSEGGITVNPAAASSLTLRGFPSSITAGTPGAFTVTAIDPYGNTATGYSGIVQFTSSDSKAVLPANATLTNGVGQFSATLKTAGTQSITVTDTAAPSLTSSEGGITVKPAAASKFILSAPSTVNPGVPFSLTVTVEDAYGNVVAGYTGTIHFSSTDSRAKLPANYTFTASDNGVHTFTGLVLRKAGNQKITITDTHNSSITGSALVDVL